MSGCSINDVREVDWYRRTTREYDYLVITHWYVSTSGSRSGEDRSEEFPPSEPYPDHTYVCQSCGQAFWFWSDVKLHLGMLDDDEPDGGLWRKVFGH